jgi:hypothetical protein
MCNLSKEDLQQAIDDAKEWKQDYWVEILEDNLSDLKSMEDSEEKNSNKNPQEKD